VALQQVENDLWRIDYGLLHGKNLFRCWWGWCVSKIVVPNIVVVVVAAPGVGHLKNRI
jgi:hypothetical protein